MSIKGSLTFDQLRLANQTRLPLFINSKGEKAHEKSDGSDWTLADWVVAVTGELDEAANVIKKVRRGDISLGEAQGMLANEFADVIIYMDILAQQCDIDLSYAVQSKFNKKSNDLGIPVWIMSDGTVYAADEDGEL